MKPIPILGLMLAAGWLPAQTNRADLADYAAWQIVPWAETNGAANLPAVSVRPGQPFALLPGQALQLEWPHPRDVQSVEIHLQDPAPVPDALTLAWWRRIWPDNGTGGWMKLDDPFNGAWTTARFSAVVQRSHVRLNLLALTTNEAPGIQRAGFNYRHTYKLRLACARPLRVRDLAVYSDALLKTARLRFEWNVGTTVPGRWAPHYEVRNGHVRRTMRSGPNTDVVEVEYADSPNRLSADRGLVICRSGEYRSFSVFVDDVLREGGLYVRDIGAFVSDAGKNMTFATWPGPTGEFWKDGTIMEQVGRMPEQSLAGVERAIPLKPANYLFLGVPYHRQKIALGPKGDLRLLADSLRTPGPDADRRPWKWKDLIYRFSPEEQPGRFDRKDARTVTRRLEAGWLPVAIHEWNTGDVAFIQTSVAAPLTNDFVPNLAASSTAPVVLVTEFKLANTGSANCTATLLLEWNHPTPWRLEADGLLVMQQPSEGELPPGLTPVRGRFNVRGKGALEILPRPAAHDGPATVPAPAATPSGPALRYQVPLPPGESHRVEFSVPYSELLDRKELAALRNLAFDRVHASAVNFWQARVAHGMAYDVPERYLNDFFKANLWHVLITTETDPVTGQFQHGAATHHYKNYLNETMMVARSLEMRGEHLEARRLIETFLANQGVKGLPGNFKSQDGVLYAAHPAEPDPYTAQGYNMHHGWGLWAAAEHYFWTRDAAWLGGHAGQLVKGCDWITRERQATKTATRHWPSIIHGLVPAGDLEDVEEYHYFYATDAYYYLGMKRAAEALAVLQHPAAARLARDAADFLSAIRASVAESVAVSPVVRLKDGTWIPYVPPRVHGLTHLKEGWIREGLYPALHLVAGEVYPASHPYVDWMIQDLEDNIFLSKESGYGVENPRANFFHFGGFTLQPNLPDLPMAYLLRGQTPNFLRGFYNTCWASLYPDVRCFTEWVPYYGKGGGPLYKTPDECKFVQWMRQMLVLERGDTLELGLGVPRAWMADGQRLKIQRAATLWGAIDMEIRSEAARNRLEATVGFDPLSPPKALWLRLRHPAGKPLQAAWVNGRPARIIAGPQLVELPVKAARWEVAGQF